MPRLLTGFIDENDCIGDSLGTEGVIGEPKGTINNNSLRLDNAVQNLSAETTAANTVFTNQLNTQKTNIASLSSQVYGTGAVLQELPTLITGLGSVAIAGSTSLPGTRAYTGVQSGVLTRKRNTSKILIRLSGGRFYNNTTASAGALTWFYVSENGGPYTSITGDTTSVEFLYANTPAVQIIHNAEYLYTPSSSVNTLQFQVWHSRYEAPSTSGVYWHYSDGLVNHFTFTLTEIG